MSDIVLQMKIHFNNGLVNIFLWHLLAVIFLKSMMILQLIRIGIEL